MSDDSEADDDMYCERHDLEEPAFPEEDPHCPKCRMEADRDARQRERMERRSNRNMHPTVDAPANAIDHSRSPSDFI